MSRMLAIDIETVGLKPYGGTIWMFAYNYCNEDIDVIHNCNGLKKLPDRVLKYLNDESIIKVVHNAVFDLPYIEIVLGIKIRNIWDTKICEFIINGHNSRISTSLKETLKRYELTELDKEIREGFIGREKGIPFTHEEIEYAKKDVEYLIDLQRAQEFLLKRDGQFELALLENKCVERVARMKAVGIRVDIDEWVGIYKKALREYEKRLSQLPGGINWNSEKQVKAFFKKRGVLIQSFSELEEITEETNNDLLRKFIAFRKLHKAVTAYGVSWLNHIDGDSRVRSDFVPLVETGRIASREPNLQNLPTTDRLPEFGTHRAAFKPKAEHVFVIGDFSGQEIGIMAAASREEVWLDALIKGNDVHSIVASQLFSEWDEHAEKGCKFPKKCECAGHLELRNKAKVLNFMLAYGGGHQKFMQLVGIQDEFTAKLIIKKYRKVIPKLTRWLDENARQAVKDRVSFSASPYRRRRILDEPEDWMLQNRGKNTPIQGAGADMLKLAMISIPEEFEIVLVIHDEIILEVPKKKAKEAKIMLKQIMEQAADYVTGIKGLIKVNPKISETLLK